LDAYEAMRADRAVAVVRADRVRDPAALAETFAAAGIRCVEFTFTIPGVLDVLRSASSADAVIGAGTVTSADQAREAVAAGAKFLVSPACVPPVVVVAREAGVPAFLGALTPTEVHAAVDAGATAIKLFPAALGGPQYIKHLRGPFPSVAFIPSGGVDESNARAFVDAGAVAVYAGSSLAPPDLVAAGEHAEIATRVQRFVASLS
jgi:2-dehydro-3-deoxyphosphogluconate aldolase/(4S)-4-hydroxy-2-oxoglutarate aldolase